MTVQIMKNTIKLSTVVVILTIVAFSSCTKELPTGGVHFCTKNDPSVSPYTIEVDGKSHGTIPYFASTPSCDEKEDFLLVEMSSQKHEIKIIDKDQMTIYECTLKANGNQMEIIDTKGEGSFYSILDYDNCNILQYSQ